MQLLLCYLENFIFKKSFLSFFFHLAASSASPTSSSSVASFPLPLLFRPVRLSTRGREGKKGASSLVYRRTRSLTHRVGFSFLCE